MAADFNVVHSQAGRLVVLPTTVTLDYILHERMRELGTEENGGSRTCA